MAEDIQIRLVAIDQATKPITELNQALEVTGLSMRKFNKYARQNFMVDRDNVGMTNQLTGKFQNYGEVVRDATLQNRRFRFEWLSIMFAGMALDRVFGSIVRSQFELYGVSSLLSEAWTITMIPVMEQIAPKLYELVDGFMNLSPEMQKIVGYSVLTGAGLGKIFEFIGQIVLAIGGFKLLAPEAFAAFASSLGAISIVLVTIIALVIGFYTAFRDNFLGMQHFVKAFVDAVKQHFYGLFEILKGILDIIVGVFTLNFEKIWKGVKEIFTGIWDFIVGGFKAAFNLVMIIIIGVLNTLREIINLAFKVGALIGNTFSGKGFTTAGALQIPSFQTGGIMPYEGLAHLHAGERIIPAGGGGSATSGIVITQYNTINVSDRHEMEKLINENNSKLVDEIKRQTSI